MKRLAFIILLCLSATLGTKAQYLVFKVGGGLASHYGSSSRNIGAFQMGIGYDYRLGGHWAIEPSLVYYAKGWKNKDREVSVYDDAGNIVYNEDTGEPMKGIMNVTSNTNYLELPILVHYNFPTALDRKFTISAGPYIAYGIGGKTKTSGDTEQTGAARYYYDHSTFDQDDMHRLDVGIQANISYHFTEQVSAGITTDWGITNVNTEGRKNRVIGFVLAYTFK